MLPSRIFTGLKKLFVLDNASVSSCIRSISLTSVKAREVESRKEMLRSLPAPDEGTVGEKVVDIDANIQKAGLFPDEDTPNRLFDGVAFKNLPIFNIKVTPNNTTINLTDHKGLTKMIRSCGVEGFKHTKKGTNIAAQATAISIGTRALEKGIKTVRVRIRGLGPGRMSAIKGLQMAGINVISITDSTRVSWNPPRPRKAKKL